MLTAFDPQRRRAAAEFSDRSCRTTKHTPQDSGDHGPARDHRAVSERSARASFISSNAFHSPARQTEERAGARPRRRAWACPGETGSNAASRGHAQAAVDCCPRWLSPTFSSPCPSLSTAGACLELGFPSPSYPVLFPPVSHASSAASQTDPRVASPDALNPQSIRSHCDFAIATTYYLLLLRLYCQANHFMTLQSFFATRPSPPSARCVAAEQGGRRVSVRHHGGASHPSCKITKQPRSTGRRDERANATPSSSRNPMAQTWQPSATWCSADRERLGVPNLPMPDDRQPSPNSFRGRLQSLRRGTTPARTRSSPSPDSARGPLGLTLLHEPSEPRVDFIFVSLPRSLDTSWHALTTPGARSQRRIEADVECVV